MLTQVRPLCPELYGLLATRFRKIKVACAGEPFVATRVPDGRGRSRLQVHCSGEYYRVNCPFCNDTRQRLWICHAYGTLNERGYYNSHLAWCYNGPCMRSTENRRSLEDMLLGFRNANNRQTLLVEHVQQDTGPLGTASPPGTCIPLLNLPSDHPAVQYMTLVRRYTPQMLQRWQVSYCVSALPQYQAAANRIVFPIWFNNQFVGWQCRYVGDVDWKATGIPKYYTMPGFHKGRVFYNYDVAMTKQFIIVVEGVTDVHFVGDHAVPLLGSTLSYQQRLLLSQIGPGKPILFLLDPDAAEGMEGIVQELGESMMQGAGRNPVLGITLPDDRDPADHDRTALWNLITAQARDRGVVVQFTS